MTITLENTYETFKLLQPFETLEEHNANISEIRKKYNDRLTKAEQNVLDHLNLYSCKFPGLSFMSKKLIANMLGISQRTVIRACKKLESLGIIVQYALKRHYGDCKQSSNAIVFQKISEENVTLECHGNNALINTKTLINTKDTENHDQLRKQGLAAKMPKRIATALSAFFDAEGMFNAYGAILRGKASVNREVIIENHENDYYNTVLSVMDSYKRGKVQKNLFGYLHKAIANTTKQICVVQSFNDVFDV